MAVEIDRIGFNQSDNVIDKRLYFDIVQAWSISSGAGTADTTTLEYYFGNKSLKIENTDPVNSLVVTDSVQSTIIDKSGTFGFAWYLRKEDALEVISGVVTIFNNAVELSQQAFSIGSAIAEDDITDKWVRYLSDVDFNLIRGNDITFTFKIDGYVTGLSTVALYWDGLMLYNKERLQAPPPMFNYQKSFLNTVIALTTFGAAPWDYILADATAAPFTINLPPADDSKNTRIIIKKIDVTANAITIDAFSSETIDGAATQLLSSQWDSLSLFCDGISWYIE